MTYAPLTIWTIILGLGIGTFLIRYSFLGLIGDRTLPAWLTRALRYTPVAVMPGLVAPLVLWPAATDGVFDPVRGAAALATVVVGLATKNALKAMGTGAAVLIVGLALF